MSQSGCARHGLPSGSRKKRWPSNWISTESVSHIERGVTVPSLKTIAAAADVLDVTLAELFAGLIETKPLTPRRAEQEALVRRISRDLDDRRLALVVELVTAVERLG